jgi:hypothetical protein
VEFYRRGNWIVGTPIWVFPGAALPGAEEPTQEDRIQKMICPHPSWRVEESALAADQETGEPIVDENFGEPVFVVKEICPVCGAIRFRYIPESKKDEPFDYSIPTKGPWYERLYNFGNFTVLVRRYQNNPTVPPSFMTRVDTPSGASYTGMHQIGTLLFSPSVLELLESMQNMARVGPERYYSFRILKEGRRSKREKEDIKREMESLARVVSEIGPESISSAQAIMEAEPQQETADMEDYEIEEMERQAQLKRELLQKRRKKPK